MRDLLPLAIATTLLLSLTCSSQAPGAPASVEGSNSSTTAPSAVHLVKGSLAPEFELPLLDRSGVRKRSDFAGRPLLLIFFDPRCPFCVQLVQSLSARTSTDERLPVLISAGTEELNQKFFHDHPVTCPVLLQQSEMVFRKYGATATPQGYLIDKNGYIESELIHGPRLLQMLSSVPVAGESTR